MFSHRSEKRRPIICWRIFLAGLRVGRIRTGYVQPIAEIIERGFVQSVSQKSTLCDSIIKLLLSIEEINFILLKLLLTFSFFFFLRMLVAFCFIIKFLVIELRSFVEFLGFFFSKLFKKNASIWKKNNHRCLNLSFFFFLFEKGEGNKLLVNY